MVCMHCILYLKSANYFVRVCLCVHLSFFNDRSCTHTHSTYLHTHTHTCAECRFILGSSMTSSETFSSTLRPTHRIAYSIYLCAWVPVCVCLSVSVCNYVLQFLTVLRLCHMPYVFAINAIMWNSTRLIKKLEAILIDMKRRQFGCEFHFWRYLRKFYFSDLQCKRIRKVNSLNVCLFAWTRMNMHVCMYTLSAFTHTKTNVAVAAYIATRTA